MAAALAGTPGCWRLHGQREERCRANGGDRL